MTIQESINERWREINAENARLHELLRRVRPVMASTEAMCERIIQGPGQRDVLLRNACAVKSEECRAALREIDEELKKVQ